MKKDFHPTLFDITVNCTCGKTFEMKSTSKEVHSTLCSNCHPFYTGQQKFVDTAGRIDKFKKKYGSK